VLSAVAFGLYGYWRAVGTARFWAAMARTPDNIAALFAGDGQGARAHLLWGAGVSFLAMQVVSPWLGGALAVGLLSLIPSPVGQVFSDLCLRAWRGLMQAATPVRDAPVEGSLAMIVAMMGAAAALCAGALVGDMRVKLVIAAVCIAGAWLLRAKPASTTLTLLLIGLGAMLLDFGLPEAAHARPTPGEMSLGCVLQDCGRRSISDLLIGAIAGGLAAAAASPWGLALGRAAAQFGGGGGADPQPAAPRSPPRRTPSQDPPRERPAPASPAARAEPSSAPAPAADGAAEPDPPDWQWSPTDDGGLPPLDDAPLTHGALTAGDDPPEAWQTDEPDDLPPPGEPVEPEAPPAGPSLADIIAMIDAKADPAEADRLKGIATRAAGLPNSDLAHIQSVIGGEIDRQNASGLLARARGAADEALQQGKDILWRNDKDAHGRGGVIRDLGDIEAALVKLDQQVTDAALAAGRSAADFGADVLDAASGDDDARQRVHEGLEDAAKAVGDAGDQAVAAGAAGLNQIAGKLQAAWGQAKNMWNDPNLARQALDDAMAAGGDLIQDAEDALSEPDPKKSDAALDRLIRRLPGGQEYLDATSDPDKPAVARAVLGLVAGLKAGGAVGTVADVTGAVRGVAGAVGRMAGREATEQAVRSGAGRIAGEGAERAANQADEAIAAGARTPQSRQGALGNFDDEASVPEGTPALGFTPDGRRIMDTDGWQKFRQHGMPPGVKNVPQVEMMDCETAAIAAVHPTRTYDEIYPAVAQHRAPPSDWGTKTDQLGGIKRGPLGEAIRDSGLIAADAQRILRTTGGLPQGDEVGRFLRAHQDIKVIAPVSMGGPFAKADHVVVIYNVTRNAAGEQMVHLFDPTRGHLVVPRTAIVWNPSDSYFVTHRS
jgi:hypothetical protein